MTFKEILRRGKWLIFDLGDYYLCSHLRMEGKYFLKKHDEKIDKHEHVIFELDDGFDLRYADVRKFGRMDLVKKELLNTVEGVCKQGREPIDNDLSTERLTKEYLYEKIHDKKLPLKELLLDQADPERSIDLKYDQTIVNDPNIPKICSFDIDSYY